MSTTVNEAGTGAKLETETPKSIATALEYADAYDRVATFLREHPDLAKRANFDGRNTFLICTTFDSDPKAAIVAGARIGREAGAEVAEFAGERFGGVRLHFGPIQVQVYANAEQVCQRVVVGMVEDVKTALTFDLDGTPRKQAEVAA